MILFGRLEQLRGQLSLLNEFGVTLTMRQPDLRD